jgi:putative SOS response-associated peptidase YedK
MCGRFTQTMPGPELAAMFQVTTPFAVTFGAIGAAAAGPLFSSADASSEHPSETGDAVGRFILQPRYNVAPTQRVAIVRQGEAGARFIAPLRWGLVPFWAKDLGFGNRAINARLEGIEDKPAFRSAWRKRRCLIPISGFYEWKTEGKRKRPFLISPADGRPAAFAGLWERWGREGEAVDSFTIVTTAANSFMSAIHDRMPVFLREQVWSAWLDPARTDAADPFRVIEESPPPILRMVEVSSLVGNPRNESPDCIKPLAERNSPPA